MFLPLISMISNMSGDDNGGGAKGGGE
jgi:hypothetical protein